MTQFFSSVDVLLVFGWLLMLNQPKNGFWFDSIITNGFETETNPSRTYLMKFHGTLWRHKFRGAGFAGFLLSRFQFFFIISFSNKQEDKKQTKIEINQKSELMRWREGKRVTPTPIHFWFSYKRSNLISSKTVWNRNSTMSGVLVVKQL